MLHSHIGCIFSIVLFEISLCGNLYFVREVHVEGGKHLNHYVTMWLYGYVQTNFNIYMEILRLCSSLHCLFFTLIRKWGVVGDLESGSR